MAVIIKDIDTKSVMTKSNLPVSDYSVNPYVGCTHACMYCYASFMKRFTNHLEPWGEFVDIKNWPIIKNPHKYAGKEAFIGSVSENVSIIAKAITKHVNLLMSRFIFISFLFFS